MIDISPNSNSPASGLRRSSRLYTNANCVKENSTNVNNTKTSKNTRTPTKRSRQTINYDTNSDQKEEMPKSNENLKCMFHFIHFIFNRFIFVIHFYSCYLN